MKQFFLLLVIALNALYLRAQVAPFIDFSNYFRSFHLENFRQIEFQPIISYQAGDKMVAYLDMRNDFKLYDGEKVTLITNQIVKYKLSDAQLAWNIGPALFAWNNGERQFLTNFAGYYDVSDSLVVYEDRQYNTMNVFYRGKSQVLFQSTGDLGPIVHLSDNICVFRDNGDFYKIFWRGKIYDLGVWSQGIQFSGSRDMLCFNDPTTRTFAVFENGEFVDVEPQYMKKYKAGWGFCVYEDLNDNLFMFKNGKKHQLSNFAANYWYVEDNRAVWAENTFYFTWQDGEKVQLTNYKPGSILIKNDIIVFHNQMGGVSVYADGKLTDVTNQLNATFKIYRDVVLIELFNKSFIAFRKGKTYET